MRLRTLYCAALLFLILPVGCTESPVDPNAPYKDAINAYWRVHPRCLWTQAVKFPAEGASRSGSTTGYDALTDMGLLQRTQAANNAPIAGGKQMSDYDLTDLGRGSWVAVKQSPGFGDLCYGHRSVTSIDRVTIAPASGSTPSMATVHYHFNLPDMADWAKNPELRTAFPGVASGIAAQVDTATLMKTSSGWVMMTPQVAPPAALPPSYTTAAETTPPPATPPAAATPPPANATSDADEAPATTSTHHHHHHHHR